MTRARGSEEMESTEAPDLEGSSFKNLVLQWSGPDLVYTKVTHWISDLACSGPCSPTVGNFLQYCFTFAEDVEEHYELKLWMLNLVTHYVAEDESWLDNADNAKDWSRLSLISDWEVSPPVWARRREEEEEKRITAEKARCLEEEGVGRKMEEMAKEEKERVAIIDSACSKPFEMQLDVSKPSKEEKVKTTIFWRPWEISCEATADLDLSCDATTLLSSKPLTPPLLVTPSCGSKEEKIMDRRLGRNMRRLLDFQSTLERERGLPPSKWLTRLEGGEATPVPVSHRNQMRHRVRRRRIEMGDAEASSPNLRGGSGGMGIGRGQCPTSPLVDTFSEFVNASRSNISMLHTTPLVETGWQRRGFCWGCRSWGNMIPMA